MSDAPQNPERRQQLLKLGSAAAFLVIVAVAVLIVVNQNDSSGGDATNVEGASHVRAELRGIPQNGMVLGQPGAKVTLIEFGDLQCPVCKGFAEEILPPVIEAKVRTGEAKIEFRNYTIISEESVPAAAAAIAAGEQGKGWNFIELFYRNQGLEASGYVTDVFLTSIAEGAGVPDIDQWNADRKSQRVLAQVSRETEQARDLNFEGTPSFAVEGPGTKGIEPIGTPPSSGAIEAAIDQAR